MTTSTEQLKRDIEDGLAIRRKLADLKEPGLDRLTPAAFVRAAYTAAKMKAKAVEDLLAKVQTDPSLHNVMGAVNYLAKEIGGGRFKQPPSMADRNGPKYLRLALGGSEASLIAIEVKDPYSVAVALATALSARRGKIPTGGKAEESLEGWTAELRRCEVVLKVQEEAIGRGIGFEHLRIVGRRPHSWVRLIYRGLDFGPGPDHCQSGKELLDGLTDKGKLKAFFNGTTTEDKSNGK